MFKTFTMIAALTALAATTIAPAHAFRALNGGGANGANENGWSNGGGANGANENGWTNGGTENGGFINGGGNNGGGANGAAGGSSTLTIQAIELPSESR